MKLFRFSIVSALFFGLIVLTSCVGDSEKKEGQVKIVATTTMVADMARRLVGEEIEVAGLMAAGVDPHTFNMPIDAVAEIKRADVLLYSGLKLEGRTEELYEPLREEGGEVLEVAGVLPKEDLLTPAGFDGFADPHVWGDPRLWAKCVDPAADAIAKRMPDHEPVIRKNAANYIKELEALHVWAEKRIAEIPEANRTLITSHDAFNYFGRAYGLSVIGIQGISTESEPSMRDIQQTAKLIREKGIKAIFAETSVNASTIETIAKDTGTKIGGELFSDSLGPAGSFETVGDETYDVGTYIGMMKHNVNTIVEALK